MAWIVKCTTEKQNKRYTRAVLSKYGQKISPSTFAFDKRVVLSAALEEIKWCEQKGISLSVEVIEIGEMEMIFV